jgi:hypothetical protein
LTAGGKLFYQIDQFVRVDVITTAALASEVATFGPYQEVIVMMTLKTLCALAVAIVAAPPFIFAQTYSPVVAMRVTTPDGRTQDVTARDSSVATIALKDGTVYELRPTVHDEPFSKVTVGIFKAATPAEPTTIVGEVQLTKGGAAMDSKTKPNFKIAVTRIDAPGRQQQIQK